MGHWKKSSADTRSTYNKEVTEIAALKGKESTFSGSTHINYQKVTSPTGSCISYSKDAFLLIQHSLYSTVTSCNIHAKSSHRSLPSSYNSAIGALHAKFYLHQTKPHQLPRCVLQQHTPIFRILYIHCGWFYTSLHSTDTTFNFHERVKPHKDYRHRGILETYKSLQG